MVDYPRSLTQNEKANLLAIFGSKIDFNSIRIGNTETWGTNTAISTNNFINFPAIGAKDDFFLLGTASDRGWFIHEIVHQWQY